MVPRHESSRMVGIATKRSRINPFTRCILRKTKENGDWLLFGRLKGCLSPFSGWCPRQRRNKNGKEISQDRLDVGLA